MKKKELLYSVLQNMGYNPTEDEDGDLIIHYQMKSIWILVGDNNDPYISVTLPQFHEIEEGKETLVLATCNKLTRDIKMIKIYIDQTLKNVTAMCGFYYTDEESMHQGLDFSLQILGIIRSHFRKTMLEFL